MRKKTKIVSYQAICFDIDNTLFPTKSFVERARENALDSMIEAGLIGEKEYLRGVLNHIIQTYGSNFGGHFDILVEKIMGRRDPKIIAAGIVGYHKTKNTILPFPRVPKTLLILREKYRLFVFSEGIVLKQWDKLIRLNLHHFFEDVFVCSEKNEESYKTLIQELHKRGIDYRRTLMVGDRYEKDVAPARKLGMHAFHIGTDINDVGDLLTLL